MVADLAAALRAEARRSNQRRLVVLAGTREATVRAAGEALDGSGIDRSETTVISRHAILNADRFPPDRAGELMGVTQSAVVVDCHDVCRPNTLGQSVGAVDGGGLLLLLAPELDTWPNRRDGFDETLAVPPYGVADVAGNFRRRLVETLRAHRGVAIVDVDTTRIERDGLIDHDHPSHVNEAENQDPASRPWSTPGGAVQDSSSPDLPRVAIETCLTADQVRAVGTLTLLREPGHAVVLEADRGRGKSSAAGIAAGVIAAEGADVLVTAPGYRNAREVFIRAAATLEGLDRPFTAHGDPPRDIDIGTGGRIRYCSAAEATDLPGAPDAVIVDEAAALPVHHLAALLKAPSTAFTTTIHGYEGAGRGFAVRFRDHLAAADRTVHDVRLRTPIRYAAGDPIETWSFRALLLDARPAHGDLVTDTTRDTCQYIHPTPDALQADEPLLRELFGNLVLAHYRTEPDDLARVLDAPNLSLRALMHDGHVLAVALLAEEGDLSAAMRRSMYEGSRVHGHMLPDILTAQLRDEGAAALKGVRVVRIATHPRIRRAGFGSHLLGAIGDEFADRDWLGAGFGATPGLLTFWRTNGYGVIHLGTSRNDTSGEYAALVLRPTSDAGRALHDKHARRFASRVGPMLSDSLRDMDPDIVIAALRAIDTSVDLNLEPHEWTMVAGAGAGPGHIEIDPGPFRQLAIKHLIDPADPARLPDQQKRLLVMRVLQGRPATAVATDLGFPSERQCMRAVGEAYDSLVELYGTDAAKRERNRYE